MDFEAIYITYYPAILRYCFRQIHNHEDAEDLAQKTLLSILEHLPHLEQQASMYLNAYIYRVASNKVIDHIRHRNLIEYVNLDYEQPLAQDFTECVEQQETITRTLECLSPFYRATLVAWIYDNRAIARGSGFKMAASRARRAFRANYARQERAAS